MNQNLIVSGGCEMMSENGNITICGVRTKRREFKGKGLEKLSQKLSKDHKKTPKKQLIGNFRRATSTTAGLLAEQDRRTIHTNIRAADPATVSCEHGDGGDGTPGRACQNDGIISLVKWKEEGRSEERERAGKPTGGTEEQTYIPYSVYSGMCASPLPFPLGEERLIRWTGHREAIRCAWGWPCLPKRRQRGSMDEIEAGRRGKEARKEGGQGGKGGARAGRIEERTWHTISSPVRQTRRGTGAGGLLGHAGAGASDGQAEVYIDPRARATEHRENTNSQVLMYPIRHSGSLGIQRGRYVEGKV
ncbi:hypothetical protein B0H14DRAFT_2583669 [Mycena olivaceomarginata]|nr:hypothetical protein B0H14DRAFT_2583669 [Mycena olivaceomarginata]